MHRDVKPGNVLIDTVPGRPEHAYLSDFGLTKADSSMTGLTAAGSFLGTADYCAPEQINGWQVNGRGDQYALACVAFQLLTGTVPFPRAKTLATLFAHVNEPSPAASAILAGLPPGRGRGARQVPRQASGSRYASCGEFAAALRAALLSARPLGAPLAADTWAAYPEPAGVDERAWVPPSAISVPPAGLPPIGRTIPPSPVRPGPRSHRTADGPFRRVRRVIVARTPSPPPSPSGRRGSSRRRLWLCSASAHGLDSRCLAKDTEGRPRPSPRLPRTWPLP